LHSLFASRHGAVTTALTATVGSSGVKVLLIVVSAVQIGVADPVSWSGVAIVVASLVTYSYLNLQKPAPKPPAADAEAPKEGTPLIKP
jgi:hypothetical protein